MQLRNGILWAVVTAAGAVSFEATARIEDWVQYGVPISSQYNATDQLVIRAADGMHGRRSAAFQKWRMNGLGFRGPAADSQKTAGRLRVITVGASETFGLYESPDHEFPRQLEDSLRRTLAGSRCAEAGVEVWNGAFAGMTLPTIVQDVEQRLVRFAPDVVAIYPTPAFYLLARRPVAALPDSAPPAAAPRFLPRTWPRLVDQVKQLVPGPLATVMRSRRIASVRAQLGIAFDTLPAERVEWFAEDLTDLVAAVRAIGAVPVVGTHANEFGFGTRREPRTAQLIAWQRFHPLATGDVLIAFDSAAREATLAVSRRHGAEVADVAAALAADTGSVFADYAHFNDRGAAVAAGSMASAIGSAVAGMCR